jgi:hypothetical protein
VVLYGLANSLAYRWHPETSNNTFNNSQFKNAITTEIAFLRAVSWSRLPEVGEGGANGFIAHLEK